MTLQSKPRCDCNVSVVVRIADDVIASRDHAQNKKVDYWAHLTQVW
jgi:hypothetical protein